MKNICSEYIKLFNKFISSDISTEEFQDIFFHLFKNEKRSLDSDVYELLQEAFGDIDSFTRDEQLLVKDPDFYLDEYQLREKIKIVVSDLEKIDTSG